MGHFGDNVHCVPKKFKHDNLHRHELLSQLNISTTNYQNAFMHMYVAVESHVCEPFVGKQCTRIQNYIHDTSKNIKFQ